MRILVALVILTACLACGRSSNSDPAAVTTSVDAQRREYIASFDASVMPPCDNGTFLPLFDRFGENIDLYSLRSSPGIWNRNAADPCTDSATPTSPDVYLAVALSLESRADAPEIAAMASAMQKFPFNQVEFKLLYPLFNKVSGGNWIVPDVAMPQTEGFRAHLVWMYIELKLSTQNGVASAKDISNLKALVDSTPDSPILAAAYARYTNGDFTKTLDILSKISDNIKSSGGDYTVDFWGSLSAKLAYIISVSLIEGS